MNRIRLFFVFILYFGTLITSNSQHFFAEIDAPDVLKLNHQIYLFDIGKNQELLISILNQNDTEIKEKNVKKKSIYIEGTILSGGLDTIKKRRSGLILNYDRDGYLIGYKNFGSSIFENWKGNSIFESPECFITRNLKKKICEIKEVHSNGKVVHSEFKYNFNYKLEYISVLWENYGLIYSKQFIYDYKGNLKKIVKEEPQKFTWWYHPDSLSLKSNIYEISYDTINNMIVNEIAYGLYDYTEFKFPELFIRMEFQVKAEEYFKLITCNDSIVYFHKMIDSNSKTCEYYYLKTIYDNNKAIKTHYSSNILYQFFPGDYDFQYVYKDDKLHKIIDPINEIEIVYQYNSKDLVISEKIYIYNKYWMGYFVEYEYY